MARRSISSDVTVEDGELVTVTLASPARSTRRGGPVLEAEADIGGNDDLRAALRGADFEIAAEFIAAPASPAPSRRRGGPALEAAAPPRVAVAVAPGESAVLLYESEGGVFAWATEGARVAGPARRRGEPGASPGRDEVVTFELTPPRASGDGAASAGGRRGITDWLIDKAIEPVRTYVLRFVVTKAIDAAVARIEGDNPLGPVVIQGVDPSRWVPAPIDFTFDGHAPVKILLMVHGTFSSTMGSFGGLAGSPKGGDFLRRAEAHYDLILGHDHRTLADDPETNASAILATLSALALPPGSRIDMIAFSRGGLVLRTLIEDLLPASGLEVTLGKAIFVGCTNGGTQLASPGNWKDLVDIYTNIALAAGKGITMLAGGTASPLVSHTIRTLGRFVQLFSQVAIAEGKLPGLAAMEPGGAVVKALNGSTAPNPSATYHAITSSFEPGLTLARGLTREATRFVLDRVTDRLMKEANDLVVNTASMTQLGARQALLDPAHVLALGDTALVYHIIYFADETVAGQLTAWLDLKPAPVVLPGLSNYIAPSPAPATLADRPVPRRRRGLDMAEAPAAAAPEAVAEAAPETVERFIAAEMAPQPKLGKPVNLWVAISAAPIAVADHAAADSTDLAAELSTRAPLRIEVIPRRNCTVVGDDAREFDVRADRIDTRFEVQGIAAGEAEIIVEARQGVRVIASFILKPVFVGEEAVLRVAQPMASDAPEGAGFAVLRIYEFRKPGGITLRFDVVSDDPVFAVTDKLDLDGFDMGAYVGEVLREIEEAWDLRGEGDSATLYQSFLKRLEASAKVRANALIPATIRAALWTNRANIQAIQVISDDAQIPWELMYLSDPAGKDRTGQGFLSQWGLVRWLHGAPMPGRRLAGSGGASRYVIPDYLDPGHQLSGAQEEKAMLEGLFPGITGVTATSMGVCDYLATQAADCDILHFACHGLAEQRAVLDSKLMMQGARKANGEIIDDPLTIDQIKTETAFRPGTPRALVFLNACQTGRSGEGLAGVSGFADSFIRPVSGQGAAAFVAALWSVDDRLALTFAETFYGELKAGKTIVEATRAARTACDAKHDFTWLAYSVYGNPYARMG